MTIDRENYWRYYGLQKDPFVSPLLISSENYVVPRWEEYSDLLHYLCRSNNALLLVTGVKGSGKTMFMQQFVLQLDETTQLCQLSGSADLDAEKIIDALVQAFYLVAPHGENLEERIETLVLNLQQVKQSCLLIIDDADQLTEKTLQLLLSIIRQQSEAQMRLHILLLGLPQLNERLVNLNTEANEAELIHQVRLESLTLEETQHYIKYRLMSAGLPAALPFSQVTLSRIHHLSEGVLERINVIARQVLIDSVRQPQLHATLDFVREYRTQLVGGSILFVVLMAVAIMLARGNHVPHFEWPKFHHAAVSVPAAKPVAEVEEQKTIVISQPIESAPTTEATLAFMQPRIDFSFYQKKSQVTNKVAAPIENKNIVSKDKKISQPVKSIGGLVKANPQHYTLQLIGLSNLKAARAFLVEHHLVGRATIVRTHRLSQDWYVLVMGEYETLQQATAAIQKLPKELQSYHPWPRKISTIQQVIKQ